MKTHVETPAKFTKSVNLSICTPHAHNMDECSVFDLPDIALGKIITHLNFRDKVALSAASKAGQEVFNAPDTVVKWGAIWGRLRIAVTTRGVEVHKGLHTCCFVPHKLLCTHPATDNYRCTVPLIQITRSTLLPFPQKT